MSNVTIITEKPSVARKMVVAFSTAYKIKFKREKGLSRYNPIHSGPVTSSLEFWIDEDQYSIEEGDQLTISSVLGHVLNYEYPEPFSKSSSWKKTDFLKMLEIRPIEKAINENMSNQLKELGKTTEILVIATDWDGHGESIGNQICSIISKRNSQVIIGRMRFTSTDIGTLSRSFQKQAHLDQTWVAQVDSLRKQDLRMGATFTRFLTVGVQEQGVPNKLISYGPCQTSLLWIIANRARERQEFEVETFWELYAEITDKKGKQTWRFHWKEGRQFDRTIIDKTYARIQNEEYGIITNIDNNVEVIKRPLPLDTDTLESDGARIFVTSPKNVADVAEKLYNQGFITYPRTESSYYHEKDLSKLLGKFLEDGPFKELAEKVRDEGNPKDPSKGRFTKDHEPIKPVKSATSEEIKKAIRGSERERELAWKVYDFIVRRFLATIHREASKEITKMKLTVGTEVFIGEGTKIVDQGFYDIFPFRKIREYSLPKCKVGDKFTVNLGIHEGKTRPPPLWREYNLIREMSAKGIGTDATRSTHIATVKKRRFVAYSGSQGGLEPTPLGKAIFEILTNTAEELIRPEIRATVESWTQEIRSGEKTSTEVDQNVIDITLRGLKAMMASRETIFPELAQSVRETTGEGEEFGECPECGASLILRHSRRGKRFLACENTECSTSFALPKKGKLATLNNRCDWCGVYPIRVGSGTRTWVFCPRCWTALSDDEGLFFCSRCQSQNCPFAVTSNGISSKDRGFMGDCPDCSSEVILTIDGFRTKVLCTNEKCAKTWNAPNIRKGTQIQIGKPCKSCGMKVLEVKRQNKPPYGLCVSCGKFV